jgi:hypothetical protein
LTAQYDKRSNNCGVSESIGFLLIFTIVIAGIGLVTLYGYPMLIEQQVSADEKIMEKNMIVLQNDIKSLTYKTIPYKSTSLKIGGGALTVYDTGYSPSVFTMDITDGAGSSYLSAPFRSGELGYASVSSQTDISLQNGAVVMRPRILSGSTMIAEPRWFFDDSTNTMVINLIKITSTDYIAKEGIGTVQMELVGEPAYNETIVPSGQVVKIVYTHDTTRDYSIAWNNYFTKTLNMPFVATSGSTDTYMLPFDPTRPGVLVVKIFTVKIVSI